MSGGENFVLCASRAVVAALLLIQVVRVHAEMPSDARTAALIIPISLLLG
jgi:hypothetical protein